MVNFDKYLEVFIDESKDNLQKISEYLLVLGQNPTNMEIVNDLFRSFHNIKGMSMSMNINDMARLTHKAEDVLELLRNGLIKTDINLIDALFKCVDKLNEIIALILKDKYVNNTCNIEPLIEQLNKLQELSNETSTSVLEPILSCKNETKLVNEALLNDYRTFKIKIGLTNSCQLPAARAYMIINELKMFDNVIKSVPTAEDFERGLNSKLFELYILTDNSVKEFLDLILKIQEIQDISVEQFNTSNDSSDSQEEFKLMRKNTKAKTVAKNSKSFQVNSEKLNELIKIVGELVISQAHLRELLSEVKTDEIVCSMNSISSLTSAIQDLTFHLRTVPAEQIFNRFTKLVKDLSKDQNKLVDLVITSQNVEIDKEIADEMSYPILHLVRNAIDHGIETPEERIKANKDANGILELKAFNCCDKVVIEIIDDGRGVDLEKIKQAAISKGIVPVDKINKMTRKEIMEQLFLPGLSTMETVTEVSGRGVGLDVVKSKINSLGGQVLINSKVGFGTTITLVFPSAIKVIDSFLIGVEDEIYAVPFNNINEIIEIRTNEIKTADGKETVRLKGKTIPIIRLVNADENRTTCKKNVFEMIMIVKYQDKQLGLIISELIGTQEVTLKENFCIEKPFIEAKITESEKTIPVVNINFLFKQSEDHLRC